MTEADMRRLLARKRDGEALPNEAWADVVAGVMDDSLDRAQCAALLMAVTLRGINETETIALTRAMIASGQVLDYPDLFVVDKHSSGGVGDTTSLLVVPWAAAAGMHVAKLAGRALGHTGGTIDKLESVPGLRTDLSAAEFQTQVARIGCAIAAQSATLVPADKRLYALRDFTATVPSVGLIAASIVSKKIAAGAQVILYDVKVGRGAFMRNFDEARALAQRIIAVTKAFGRAARVIISDMDEPLGRGIGDGLEMREAISILDGTRPLVQRLPRLARYLMHALVELNISARGAAQAAAGASDGFAQPDALDAALRSGAALRKFRELLAAQGGDYDAFLARDLAWPRTTLCAKAAGYVTALDPIAIGEAARKLHEQAGPMAGLELLVQSGSYCEGGAPLLHVYGQADLKLDDLGIILLPNAPPERPLVLADLGDGGHDIATV